MIIRNRLIQAEFIEQRPLIVAGVPSLLASDTICRQETESLFAKAFKSLCNKIGTSRHSRRRNNSFAFGVKRT